MINRRYIQPSKYKKNFHINPSRLTLQQLGLIRNIIDIDQNQNRQIKQKLIVQKSISNQLLKSIDQEFNKAQNQVLYYFQKLEQEKNKYHKLEVLVSHYQKIMMQQKLDLYQNKKNSLQTDQYTDLKSKLKQLQRELEIFKLKFNGSLYENKKKLDQVKAERSERAVSSGLFYKLQQQLFHLQFYYKQLTLERQLVQKLNKQNFQQYHNIQHSSILNIEKVKQNSIIKTKNSGQYLLSTHSCNNSNLKQPNYFPRTRNKLLSKKYLDRSQKTAISCKKLSQIQLSKMQWQKKFKNLTYQLGIPSISQIKNQVQNLSFNLQHSYQIIEQFNDKIAQIESIIHQKQSKQQIYQDNHIKIQKQTKQIKQKNHALTLKIKDDNNQIKQFNENIHKISQLLFSQMQDKLQTSIDSINQKILSICPHYTYNPYIDQKITKNLMKLEIILDRKQPINNSVYLYTEQELIQLSRQKLIKQQGKDKKKTSIKASKLKQDKISDLQQLKYSLN